MSGCKIIWLLFLLLDYFEVLETVISNLSDYMHDILLVQKYFPQKLYLRSLHSNSLEFN